MSLLSDISFLRPLWLLALPLIFGFGMLLARRAAHIGSWYKVVEPKLMNAMRELGRVDEKGGTRLRHLPLWVAGLVVLGLTGPAVERRDAQSFRNLDGVVFVVDLSTSVTGSEMFGQLVTMGRIGVSALGSKPAAMIVYAGDAYLASALTADTRQIGLSLSLLDGEVVPDQGSRPALALAMAREVLEQSEIVAGDVVLLTDGAGLGPEAIAQAGGIASGGGRLSVVHLPGANGVAVDTVAETGAGQVFGLSDGDRLAEELRSNASARMERQDYLLLFWSDYGRFVLLLALVPALGLFRRIVS